MAPAGTVVSSFRTKMYRLSVARMTALWFAPNPDRSAGARTRTSGSSAMLSATGVLETLSRTTTAIDVCRPGSAWSVRRHSIARPTVSWQTMEITRSGADGTVPHNSLPAVGSGPFSTCVTSRRIAWTPAA